MKKILWALVLVLICLGLAGCMDEDSDKIVYSEGSIQISSTSNGFKGQDFKVVEERLIALGFQNIEFSQITDLVFGFLTKDGAVEKVTINDHLLYSSDSTFAPDAKIVIYYHTFSSDSDSSSSKSGTVYTEGDISIGSTSKQFKGKDYQAVKKQLTEKGFENVEFSPIEDLIIGFLTEDGEIEKVSVNNHEDYSSDSTFASDTKIVIYYHTFPSSSDSSGGNSSSGNSGNNGGNQQTQTRDKIGDAVSVGVFEYTVLSVRGGKKIGNSFHTSRTDGMFVLIEVQVKNTGSSQKTLYESDMTLFHNGSEYEIYDESWAFDDCFSVLEEIGAKMTKSFTLIYELPEDYTTNDYLQVKGPGLFDGKGKIYLSE